MVYVYNIEQTPISFRTSLANGSPLVRGSRQGEGRTGSRELFLGRGHPECIGAMHEKNIDAP